MIKLRLASMADNEGDLEIPIVEGELLSDAVKRCLKDTKITEEYSEIFNVAVNGLLVDGDFWSYTGLKETDNVLIAPKIKNAKNVGQALLIVALAVTAAYTGGATAAGSMHFLTAGLINAGVAVVGSYLLSQLIPPPILDTAIGGSSIKESQVYSITSQANAVRKFGTVPKVYGRHRMFPIVAANPYTELEADPNTGIYSQYFYAIYDFGLGPVQVEDLKIGNTRLSEFDQVKFNLVDPNKPLTNEGAWDNATRRDFVLYKGDVSSEAVGSTINKNQSVPGDPIDQYQTVRSAAINPNLLSQEITLNLVCPRGLYAFDSVGNIGYRTIETYIEYQKVTETNNWKPFNDPATVTRWSMVGGGGSQAYTDIQMQFIPAGTFDPGAQSRYAITYNSGERLVYQEAPQPFGGTSWTYIYETDIHMGVPIGALQVIMSGEANVGDSIKVGDNVLGKVQTKVLYGAVGLVTYYTYTFVSPTTFRVDVQGSKKTRVYIAPTTFPFIPLESIGWTFTFYNGMQGKKEVITPGKFQIRAKTQEPHFATIKFTPNAPGAYQVRVTRISTSSAATTNVMDELTWVNINTRSDTNPIRTTKRHTFLEIKIKASGQLNGALQNLSAVCTSVLDTWNGTSWVKAPTTNPAWIYADILTGEVTKKPIDKSRLHLPSLVEWANYANTVPPFTPPTMVYSHKRFECNFVLDFETTVQNLLQQIAGMGQCTPNIIDGKYGVLLDINRTTPVQLFTPRNSWGFASSKNYAVKPHAVKVAYIDPQRDWQPNEVTVYDDAYNAETAEEFQDLSSFGVTNVEQATRYGRFFAAQHKFRQETFTIKVDFENLICTRGDFVQITQDVMKVGGIPARVKTVVGNQITIDDSIPVGPGSWGYHYRSSAGVIATNTLTIVNSSTFDLDGAIPAPGDLIVIGFVGSIVFDCIVKAITPEADFTATLTLVEKAENMYGYENVSILSAYDPNITPIAGYEGVAPPAVTNLVVTNNRYVIGNNGIDYFIDIDWDMPIGSSFEAFEVYVDSGKGYELQTVIKASNYTYEVDVDDLGIEHKFKVLAVSSTGKKLILGEAPFVAATPLEYDLPPPDVTGFALDISGETIQFSWNQIRNQAIESYLIRYSPVTNGTWEESTVVNELSAGTNLYSTQARLGAYFIKAINFNGDESVNAAKVITTVPVLPNVNLIATIDDFPDLEGSVESVIKSPGSLILDQSVFGTLGNEQFYAEGFYYFKNTLNLVNPFTVRLTAKIIAQGITLGDLMINWENLAEVESLTSVKSADWDVELQYRTVENFIPISDWSTMSSIAQIGAGNGTFTDYRKFLVGDATGATFQFRLKITSYNPSVTPRVSSAIITAEMVNRKEEKANLSAPDTGLTVTYDNAFYGPGTTPNVQPSILNQQSGDYWVFSSQTLSDFTIVFYNNLNNPVARQFSFAASGYGRQTTDVI